MVKRLPNQRIAVQRIGVHLGRPSQAGRPQQNEGRSPPAYLKQPLAQLQLASLLAVEVSSRRFVSEIALQSKNRLADRQFPIDFETFFSISRQSRIKEDHFVKWELRRR